MNKRISELFDYGDEIAVTEGIEAMFDPAEIKEITMKKLHETTPRPRRSVRRAVIIAVAACLLLALGITAYATGFAKSIIAQISAGYAAGYTTPDPDPAVQQQKAEALEELLQKAAEQSNKEPETVGLAGTEAAGESFTLEESYYDGENLMLVYSLDALLRPVEFGYGPGGEHFEDLWSAGEGYAIAFQATDFTPEDFEKVLEILRGTEPAGFILRSVSIGDHIRLADGTELGPMMGMQMDDGKVFLQNRDPLPETARNKDALEVTFYIKESPLYYYKDGKLEYTYCPVTQGEPVTFTVPNCG